MKSFKCSFGRCLGEVFEEFFGSSYISLFSHDDGRHEHNCLDYDDWNFIDTDELFYEDEQDSFLVTYDSHLVGSEPRDRDKKIYRAQGIDDRDFKINEDGLLVRHKMAVTSARSKRRP